MDQSRGVGQAMFASVLLMVGGVLNVIWGIAPIGHSRFFENSQHYLFGSLRGWGWIMLILGVLELIAAFSLVRGASPAGTSRSLSVPLPRSARCYRSRLTRCGRSRYSR